MKLVTLTKLTQVGNSATKSQVIMSGITKTMADKIIAKSPRTVVDTVYVIK